MTERMTTEEIIRKDCERYNLPFQQFYDYLRLAMSTSKFRAMRDENSLLVYQILSPGVADLHLITADPLNKVVQSLKNFVKAMDKSGFKKGVATIKDKSFLQLLRRARVPYKATPASENVNGKMVHGYQITIEL
jgi:hypothetical protein